MPNYSQEFQDKKSFTIGGFFVDRQAQFNDSIQDITATFENTTNVNPINDFSTIINNHDFSEVLKESLFSDLSPDNVTSDPNYVDLQERCEMIFDNSREDMVKESAAGIDQMSPVVALSPYVLKKHFLVSHARDIMNTEVSNSLVIKKAFERDYVVAMDGSEFAIPEVYYSKDYEKVVSGAKGPAINTTIPVPNNSYDLLAEAGGSLVKRDTLNYDTRITKIHTSWGDVEVNIQPMMGTDGTFKKKINNGLTGVDFKEVVISGEMFYSEGKISISATSADVTSVTIEGTLSNINNNISPDLTTRRENIEWIIPEQARFNTGLTVEKIKDWSTALDFDVTAKYIHLMGENISQIEDWTVFDFLDKSLEKWSNMDNANLPYGYTDGFTYQKKLSLTAPDSKMYSSVDWVEKDVKHAIDRFIANMKLLLKTSEIGITIYGHPNSIEILNSNVQWVVDDSTTIGALKLDHKYGVLTNTGTRVNVVSTLKCPQEEGLRFVSKSLVENFHTFHHYKYSFNISREYRNPSVGNIPNIMATSRYLTTEFIPLQGKLVLEGSEFILQDLDIFEDLDTVTADVTPDDGDNT